MFDEKKTGRKGADHDELARAKSDEHSLPGLPNELAHEQRETIRVLEPYLHTRHYRAGQVLWTKGEVSGRLVLMVQGRVKAVRVLPDGSSVLLYVFSAGDIFGFLPFVDGGPYPATAITVNDVEARVMSRSELRRAIQKDPQVAMVLLGALGKRLRQAFGRLGDQAQRSSLARVAAALSLLIPAEESAPTTAIDVPTPIHDFAADVGMTPETFSRAVTQLVEVGVLHRLSLPRLQVLDARRLRSIAAGQDDGRSNHHKTDSD